MRRNDRSLLSGQKKDELGCHMVEVCVSAWLSVDAMGRAVRTFSR